MEGQTRSRARAGVAIAMCVAGRSSGPRRLRKDYWPHYRGVERFLQGVLLVSLVRILEISQISPPQGSIPPTSLPLTFFDVIWLYSPPVERLFFYSFPYPTSHFIDSFLPTLKSSLSATLQSFYPLAGNLRRRSADAENFDIVYVDGDAINFTVAEYDDDDDFPELCRALHEKSRGDKLHYLVAIQATLFPERGIAIGISVHHAACDGTTSMSFMSSWASACRLRIHQSIASPPQPQPPPLIDRTLISDPNGFYSIFFNDLLSMDDFEFAKTSNYAASSDIVLSSFTLTQDHIRSLKKLVMAKAEEKKASFHCSTIVVAFAYSWIGFCQARGVKNKKVVHFIFPVDFRKRIKPSLPEVYFGNCVGPSFVELDVAKTFEEEEDGIFIAAEAVGRAIEGLSDGLQGAERWLEKAKSIASNLPMSAAGSPKFRVYDVDFGWGRPAKVEVVSISETGAISMAESRGDGGIEIGLALPKHQMECFENYFTSGLKNLVE
ncbi:anthocyanidin 3-O-glucoside 6''-O-acyltransferase-like [Typha latifolia]|uniref:anthocyanidin 3-O-glucoside 6''-O-acyltransferase-like n=1 Tax=Typha latifolia TaxID=4733 RepID=UPI003C2F7B8D